ncbi:hypothetical protein F383_32641 [Gossypium arboreum]|uniref:Uncharacterized protein n=1 Tax=Gossypium arboreum TaxID=29729 RepID=A0A0B0MZI3_GOSAR|nr:hypothetical protein F383_32641 [Gossypium arboreum]
MIMKLCRFTLIILYYLNVMCMVRIAYFFHTRLLSYIA